MECRYDSNWAGKNIFITGVCGSVGAEVLRQVVSKNPEQVIGIDNNESEIFFLSEKYRDDRRVKLYVGDLRDTNNLERKIRGINIVIHTAALKHVILCEESPRDAVQTNIIGTQNVIDAALRNSVDRVLFTSSDKAVNPTNVMGTSKLMGERLISAANAQRCKEYDPIFASCRFGNVLGSRGSVIPLFKNKIASGGPVTLTSPEMTRFIMTLQQAVAMVLDSLFMAKGGEVFVTKMPVVRIEDLAHAMIEVLAPQYGYKAEDINIDVIGPKAGEKLFEELLTEEETRRTIELERFFTVLPAFRSVYEDTGVFCDLADKIGKARPYNSSNERAMTRKELSLYLLENKLLDFE